METEKKASIIPPVVLIFCPALLILTISAACVQASPVLTNITVTPSNPWIGWDVAITAECNDSGIIESVHANVSGPTMSFSNLELGHVSGKTYGLSLRGSDLSETGNYDVSVGCRNEPGEEAQGSGSFKVSRLSGEITSVADSWGYGEEGVVYNDEEFDVYFMLKKDDVSVTMGADFRAKLNNEYIAIQEPIPYVSGKGQRLRMIAPEDEGNYMLEFEVEYQGEVATDEMVVEVMELLKLDLMNIDKTTISDIAPIMMKLKATERGSPVAIKEQDITVTINSAGAEISSITQEGDAYAIEFMPPNLSPGSYTMRIEFLHNDVVRVLERDFDYSIPVSGKISNDGKGLNVRIIFDDENGVSTTFTTDGAGLYSGALSPGTYDVVLEHAESKITLHDVDVDEFDDPIKYNYLGVVGISGISNAGLFVYETALSYTHATIEMHYKEKSVEGPESMLDVYRCPDWNGEECFSDWEEVDSEIDTVRDIARVTAESLSAYAVGTREGIAIEIGVDKEEYNLYETIEIEGIVTYGDNRKLADALVTAKIRDTTKSKTVHTNKDGIFSVDFTVPDKEGEHTIEITVEKEPFSSLTSAKTFDVVKSRGLSLSVPTGIRMDVLGNKTVEFSVKNTGQLELTGVAVFIEEVPDGIMAELDAEGAGGLGPNEEATLFIQLVSLENITKTYTMDLVVETEEGVTAEKTFALTTERRGQSSQPGDSGTGIADAGSGGTTNESLDFSVIGNAIAGISGGAGYLLAIFIGSVFFALVMRKRRLARTVERDWVKHKLSGMRLEINKHKPGSADEIAANKNESALAALEIPYDPMEPDKVNANEYDDAGRRDNSSGTKSVRAKGSSENALDALIRSMDWSSAPKKRVFKTKKKVPKSGNHASKTKIIRKKKNKSKKQKN